MASCPQVNSSEVHKLTVNIFYNTFVLILFLQSCKFTMLFDHKMLSPRSFPVINCLINKVCRLFLNLGLYLYFELV